VCTGRANCFQLARPVRRPEWRDNCVTAPRRFCLLFPGAERTGKRATSTASNLCAAGVEPGDSCNASRLCGTDADTAERAGRCRFSLCGTGADATNHLRHLQLPMCYLSIVLVPVQVVHVLENAELTDERSAP
jgi:hypothetical protein